MREPMNFWEWSDGPGREDLTTSVILFLALVGWCALIGLALFLLDIAIDKWKKRIIEEHEASKDEGESK